MQSFRKWHNQRIRVLKPESDISGDLNVKSFAEKK